MKKEVVVFSLLILAMAGCGRDAYIAVHEQAHQVNTRPEAAWTGGEIPAANTDRQELPINELDMPEYLEIPAELPQPSFSKIQKNIQQGKAHAGFYYLNGSKKQSALLKEPKDCTLYQAPGKLPIAIVHFEKNTAREKKKFFVQLESMHLGNDFIKQIKDYTPSSVKFLTFPLFAYTSLSKIQAATYVASTQEETWSAEISQSELNQQCKVGLSFGEKNLIGVVNCSSVNQEKASMLGYFYCPLRISPNAPRFNQFSR